MSENHRYQKIPDVDTTRRPSLSQKKSFSLGVSPRHVDIPMIEMSPLDIDMEIADGKSGRSTPISDDEHERSLSLAVNASWAVNWFLLIAKGITYAMSASKAVLAALVDSAVDLVSQAVLALAENYMSKFSPNYPVGRSRLEALSVIACAFIMSTASLEVVQYSTSDLYEGVFHHKFPFLEVNLSLYVILGVGIVAKFVLWVYCVRLNTVAKSDMLEALAEDHLNDVLSNAAAMITASIAYNTTAWWVDPAGAILISVIIISRWINIIYEQVKKVVGHTAPQEFIDQLEELAKNHHEAIDVDVTRAYHFGARYNVEMEIVLPGKMTVEESHDIALALQHKIESLPDVERAFVHVDHQKRDGLEHKVERELVRASTGPSSPEHTLFQGNILPASYSSNA